MEIGSGTSKLTNAKNIEGEINANGNQAILLENSLKVTLLVRMLPICLNGTLMMQRSLYCQKDSILFQHATI